MIDLNETPIRPLELEPADFNNTLGAALAPFNPEPEVRVRPLELEVASVEERREAHGVEARGMGRGGSTQRIGLDATADRYVTAKRGIATAAEARRLFGLDWTVSKRPLFAQVGEAQVEVADQRAVVRDDTGEVLGVVGARYAVMQNDVLDLLDAITNEAPIVRGGVWNGGRQVWLQTEVTEFETPSGPAKGNGVAATSHDGSIALQFTRLGNVIVCRNTFRMNLAKSPSSVKIKHTPGSAKALEQIKRALAESRTHFAQVADTMMTWGRTRLSASDLTRFTDTLFPKSDKNNKRRDERVDQFMHAYQSAPGAMPGTAWGLAQASTYYAEHMREIRAGNDRFQRAFNDEWTQEAFQHVHLIAGTVR